MEIEEEGSFELEDLLNARLKLANLFLGWIIGDGEIGEKSSSEGVA